jgi:hypothetical protein
MVSSFFRGRVFPSSSGSRSTWVLEECHSLYHDINDGSLFGNVIPPFSDYPQKASRYSLKRLGGKDSSVISKRQVLRTILKRLEIYASQANDIFHRSRDSARAIYKMVRWALSLPVHFSVPIPHLSFSPTIWYFYVDIRARLEQSSASRCLLMFTNFSSC